MKRIVFGIRPGVNVVRAASSSHFVGSGCANLVARPSAAPWTAAQSAVRHGPSEPLPQ